MFDDYLYINIAIILQLHPHPLNINSYIYIYITYVLLEAENEILTTLYITFALSRISNENDVRPDRTLTTRTRYLGQSILELQC